MTDFYTGPSLEQGGTSIQGQGPAPFVRLMAEDLEPGTRILDYGAGKYARNADFLRELGFTVYAYDPFNGRGKDGYRKGAVSKLLPLRTDFDLGLTSYVLNVVPEKVEDDILAQVKRLSSRQIHITRTHDIFVSVRKALRRCDPTVCDFFEQEYLPGRRLGAAFHEGRLTDSQIMAFCLFGVQTTRGFQRIPQLEEKGFAVAGGGSGYRAFTA